MVATRDVETGGLARLLLSYETLTESLTFLSLRFLVCKMG